MDSFWSGRSNLSPLFAEFVGPHQSSREGTFTDQRERDEAAGS
jgi:hypothetical protein